MNNQRRITHRRHNSNGRTRKLRKPIFKVNIVNLFQNIADQLLQKKLTNSQKDIIISFLDKFKNKGGSEILFGTEQEIPIYELVQYHRTQIFTDIHSEIPKEGGFFSTCIYIAKKESYRLDLSFFYSDLNYADLVIRCMKELEEARGASFSFLKVYYLILTYTLNQ